MAARRQPSANTGPARCGDAATTARSPRAKKRDRALHSLSTAQHIGELDRLGDQIAELSAHLGAATARLLDLIRDFDARGGWSLASLLRCAGSFREYPAGGSRTWWSAASRSQPGSSASPPSSGFLSWGGLGARDSSARSPEAPRRSVNARVPTTATSRPPHSHHP